MAYDYEYDESGLASSYLLLSMLVPVALYMTYDLVDSTPIRRVRCFCPGCKNKNVKRKTKRKVFTIIIWIVISYLVGNIRTLKIEYKKGFNPLEVLGIDEDAGEKEIKKRLRMLLMKYNLGKAPEELRKEYEEKQKMINRAYGLVSNKKKYETWLNRESKTGEIVAIPKMIVSQGIYAFVLYSLLLGVLLPRWAYRKWKEIRDLNRVGVNFRTMEMFYEKIDDRMNQGKYNHDVVEKLMALMTRSVEFMEYGWKSNVEGLRGRIESGFGYPLRDCGKEGKGYLVLMDHLFRTGQAAKSDVEYVQKASLRLIEGMKAIGIAKRYGNVVKSLVVLESMIIQAVFDPKYWMLEIPFVRFEDLFIQENRKEKMSEEECLRAFFSGSNLESGMNVYRSIPVIKISEFSASVIETGVVKDISDVSESETENLVTRNEGEEGVRNGRSEQAVYVIPGGSIATINVTLERECYLDEKKGEVIVHAPFMKESFFVKWIVMLTIDNVIYGKIQIIDDFSKKAKVRFSIDSGELKKACECKVFVGCGEYLNRNAEKSIVIKVE
ncbi:preprotein translocase subunit Sec63 [Encephalitozoon intestinalis ATCC 50506]|uniref:Preprotein translocase subunit Sec63 n=1 Tax=Encephalitozoon intestinalis (strain ATCC 50506) TaxID=876142 RepID=E0S7K8_ENCIT|nr:preprotein translocase subunit Sec63 [Encephalitozoon intestinalis ATCC 50506]ADM11687.2 preprotein translocase subunit Sec63 [Encephalitozoon intestinalis ATCC 50506]UTX45424.1 preprotein translocase subunit Sec63 [Encephalitozoon intestinalis]